MNRSKDQIVSVGFPVAIPGVFDYILPEKFEGKVVRGAPVLVEVRKTKLWGVIVQFKDSSPCKKLKPVLEIKTGKWTDSNRSLIELYEWIASYYQCEIGKVFKPVVRKKLMETAPKEVINYRIANPEVGNLTPRQKEVLTGLLSDSAHEWTGPVLQKEKGISHSLLSALCSKGALVRERKTVIREATELSRGGEKMEICLTTKQEAVFSTLKRALATPAKPYLLHGITGSGKTYVYIELAKTACAMGKGVIILVPEISLTPQTIQRFKNAMGDVIAVMHSRMSDGERRDSLEQVVTGKKRVLIGARSAILAPMDNVGLIIVDEEHDSSYKQGEMEPRYNARDTAVMRGKFQQALVVLGSATPSMESYHNALQGKYSLLELKKRVGIARLPLVEIVDMNAEHKENNWTFLSRLLHWRITETLKKGRQIILLLNRRGYSVSLICKDCGHTYMCPNCSVHLTYHRVEFSMKCHQCGHMIRAPEVCPKCKGEHIKYRGTGIQKAEEYLRDVFPDARILRMDQDTTRRKGAHVSILESFAEKKADILLGTQMVAKGLDFPGVALVGVLQADIALHIPDFRSSERTFHLLTQVAGRAGRSDDTGEVIIQTYFPQDPAIIMAKEHDFFGFFDREIESRKALFYPPHGRLARIIVQGAEEVRVREAIGRIVVEAKRAAPDGIILLGPSPAIISRIKNDFRYSLICKSNSVSLLNKVLARIRMGPVKKMKNIKVIVDIDPYSMM
ncbi:MAG: primosomal protein N' [Chitinivibrionales bacterium]|nr:primosomal protein N' [Chitinivibrionales bacterium]